MSLLFALIAVDIGGTKTKAAAVECESPNTKSQSPNNHQAPIINHQTVWCFGHWSLELVWCLGFGHWLFQLRKKPAAKPAGMRVWATVEIPTPRADPAAFYDAIARLVSEVRVEAERAGVVVLPLVAVAHPGRFLPDGPLARGTTPNLGASRPSAFDGIRPAQELSRRLAAEVIAENDAVAQMRFGLHALLRDPAMRPRLLKETVVYLGPGTGMGGGVARIDADGGVTPVTDGHLFDLQLAGGLTAEEVFTGPAIARAVEAANTHLALPIQPARAGGLDEVLLNPASLPSQRAAAKQVADAHGRILATLIETIHAGTITKVRVECLPGGRMARHVDEPDRAWPAEDRAIVKGSRRFILGGFVGTSRGFGPLVCARALAALRERGLNDVEIFQIPVDSADAGLLGAAQAIPADIIRHHLRHTPMTE